MKKVAKPMNRYCLNKFRCDQGVSVIEMIVTLSLLSLIMIGLFRMGSSLLPALEKERRENRSMGKEKMIQRVLEKEFAKVTPPWWLSSYEIDIKKNRWEFPWYKGDKGEILSLTLEQDSLIICSTSGLPIVIKETEHIQFTLLYSHRGTPVLVKVENKEYPNKVMLFPLGSRIIPGTVLP